MFREFYDISILESRFVFTYFFALVGQWCDVNLQLLLNQSSLDCCSQVRISLLVIYILAYCSNSESVWLMVFLSIDFVAYLACCALVLVCIHSRFTYLIDRSWKSFIYHSRWIISNIRWMRWMSSYKNSRFKSVIHKMSVENIMYSIQSNYINYWYHNHGQVYSKWKVKKKQWTHKNSDDAHKHKSCSTL